MRPTPYSFARTVLLAAVAATGFACGDGEDPEITIFAAASLREVVSDLAEEFDDQHDVDVVLNFAGSNVLAQQIQAAPRADVFLSADLGWIEHLERGGQLAPGTRREIFRNQLVVIAHEDSQLELEDLRDLAADRYRALILADPAAVPAGRYARAYLESIPTEDGGDLWQAVESRVVPAADVRAALALVASDPRVVGIVYRTDARVSESVRVLAEMPRRANVNVAYWGALVVSERSADLGGRFLAFLETAKAREIISRHGFVLDE